MLCDSCKKREATNHESVRTGDGKSWREVHLCESCARKEGGPAHLTAAGLVQALLEGAGALAAPSPTELTARGCPKCGITYAEFRARGRLGCPHDYEAFQSDLLPIIEKIHHGATQHVGKSPDSGGAEPGPRQALIEARRALAQAVQSEEYEKAARLRDRVRELEAAPGEGPGEGAR